LPSLATGRSSLRFFLKSSSPSPLNSPFKP